MKELENMSEVAGNEEMQNNVTLEIQNKVELYDNCQKIMDGVIGLVSNETVLDEGEQVRLLKFLNSAKYHCIGKIKKLYKSEMEEEQC